MRPMGQLGQEKQQFVQSFTSVIEQAREIWGDEYETKLVQALRAEDPQGQLISELEHTGSAA